MVYSTDIHTTIQTVLNLADEMFNQKLKNNCLILYVYMDYVSPDDIKYVREISNNIILNETAIRMPKFNTCIVIPVDAQSNTGQFLCIEDFKYSVYTHGCRFIKKYFCA